LGKKRNFLAYKVEKEASKNFSKKRLKKVWKRGEIKHIFAAAKTKRQSSKEG